MLTKDDLDAIGALLDERVPKIIDERVPKAIDERLPKIIDERLPKIIDERVPGLIEARVRPMLDALESRIDVKFDAVHEELGELRANMVTKGFLEDRLAHYVRKPF